MTCGIYKLEFNGTDKVYIGQSVNIEKRFKEHCSTIRREECNYKILEAYKQYGLPTYEILSECNISELDTQEDECIDIYNSVDNGFNLYAYANQAPSYSGFGYGNSKFSKDSILKVVDLLISTNNAYTTISELTGVSSGIIGKVSQGQSHLWLKEEYPEKFLEMVNTTKDRLGHQVVSEKLSAKSRGIVYPPIMSPQGEIFHIDNAYKFAKERSLAPNHFQEVLNRHRKSHKGWKLCPEEQVS